jgi:hypothetical protein
MKHIYKTLALIAMSTPLAAQAHPGHAESDHVVSGLILTAAVIYGFKHAALSLARSAARIRKR